MDLTQNETLQNFYAELGIDANHSSTPLQKLVAGESKMIRELKLNVTAVLGSTNMTRKETALLALSVAANEKHQLLMDAFAGLALKEGATELEIGETYACTTIMNTNNIFYRFRHFMQGNEYY